MEIVAEKEEALFTYKGNKGYIFRFAQCKHCPCGTVEANSIFFRLGVIAYNLFIGFKRLACPGGWIRHTIGTFRWRLLQIAGRIVKHSGVVILRIGADMEKLQLFKGIRSRVYEISLCPDG